MKTIKIITAAMLSLSLTAGAALADSHLQRAINARQSLMGLYLFNIGTLGAMAQGKLDYDAAAASVAAKNLALLSSINQSAMWPEGSNNFDLDNVTRAKPEIWDNFADLAVKQQGLVAATGAMEAAAGGGLDSLRGAIGGLGGACSACHKAYRGEELK